MNILTKTVALSVLIAVMAVGLIAIRDRPIDPQEQVVKNTIGHTDPKLYWHYEVIDGKMVKVNVTADQIIEYNERKSQSKGDL